MIVELEDSKQKVEIIDGLTWGQREAIQQELMGGMKISGMSDKEIRDFSMDPAVLIKSKQKTIEVCVKKITKEDGKEIQYTKEWMDNLTIKDGDKLFDAIDGVTNPKKK